MKLDETMTYQSISKLNNSIKTYINNCYEPVLLIYLQNDKLCIQADKYTKNALKDENLVRSELEDILKNAKILMENSYSDISSEEEEQIDLPPLFAKYKSRKWTAIPLKKQLQEYFSILGYGRGKKKQFMDSQYTPVWWKEEELGMPWEDYLCPSYGKKETNTKIIKAIRHHYHAIDESEDPDNFIKNKSHKIKKKNSLYTNN